MYCFLTIPGTPIILTAIIGTFIAIYLVIQAFKGQKKAFYITVLFIILSLASIILMPCWAFFTALFQIAFGFLMYRKKIRILLA